MKVILTEDIYKLGSLGDEVNVKNGYGRNFLIPQGHALPVTKANQKQVEHTRSQLAKKRKASIEEATSQAATLAANELIFTMKAGESGKLFGAVTQKQIVEALHTAGIDLNKKVMQLPAPIKNLGVHEVPVKLHTEVLGKVIVKVVADAESLAAIKAASKANPEAAEAEATEAPAEDAGSEEQTEEAGE